MSNAVSGARSSGRSAIRSRTGALERSRGICLSASNSDRHHVRVRASVHPCAGACMCVHVYVRLCVHVYERVRIRVNARGNCVGIVFLPKPVISVSCVCVCERKSHGVKCWIQNAISTNMSSNSTWMCIHARTLTARWCELG